jgi:hypothetical protein
VRNVVDAANHYRDAMGFEYDKFWGEPPSFVILHRDGMYVMLNKSAILSTSFHIGLCPKNCGMSIFGSPMLTDYMRSLFAGVQR